MVYDDSDLIIDVPNKQSQFTDSARDISWPAGTPDELNQIELRIQQLGGRVIREPHAAGGRHWHMGW